MAQSRTDDLSDSFAPEKLPAPSEEQEAISELRQDLAMLAQSFIDETRILEGLEVQIMANADVNFDTPEMMQEQSFWEKLYQKVAPYFVPANAFLKHMLSKEKEEIATAKSTLHQLLQISEEDFAQLSAEKQRQYLLTVCVISVALLHDMRVLINKYEEELDFCINYEIIKDTTEEMVINGITTIALDMVLYHPDHAKELAEYRRQLYSEIGVVDVSIEQFLTVMRGHVEAAIHSVKAWQPKLKQMTVEEVVVEGAEKPLTQAIKQTFLAPPVEQPVVALTAAEPAAKDQPAPAPRRCVIL